MIEYQDYLQIMRGMFDQLETLGNAVMALQLAIDPYIDNTNPEPVMEFRAASGGTSRNLGLKVWRPYHSSGLSVEHSGETFTDMDMSEVVDMVKAERSKVVRRAA
jgi:hypothetical protein